MADQPSVVAPPEMVKEIKEKLGLEDSTITKCYEGFTQFDVDGSGLIDTTEMKTLMKFLGEDVTETEFAKLLSKFDKDGNGEMDFVEFVDLFCTTPGQKGAVLEYQIEKLSAKVRNKMAKERLTPEERVEKTGVEKSEVCDFLRNELAEAEACLSLPQAFMFFLFFVLATFFHEQIAYLHAMEQASIFDVRENANFAFSGIVPFENGRMGHKSILDVNNIPDFWSWISMGLVPLLWVEAWDVSEPRANVFAHCINDADARRSFGWPKRTPSKAPILPKCPEPAAGDLPPGHFGPNPRGMHMYYNRIVGAVRLRQEIRAPGPCEGDPELVKIAFGAPCYPGDYWMEPEPYESLQTKVEYTDQPGAETYFLRKNLGQDEVRAMLREMENKRWFNPRTQKIEVSFISYNANLDCVTWTVCNLFLTRAGHIMKKLEATVLWLHPYHGWYCYAADGIWVAMMMKMFLAELYDVLRYIKQLGFTNGIKVYSGFWNMVDWASVIFGFVIVLQMWLFLESVGKVHKMMENANLSVTGSWASDADLRSFYDAVEASAFVSLRFHKFCALYPFLIVLRLFKSFSAQPRLAMVTKTLTMAATDIFHFGVVFISVFMAYAVSGFLLFGEELSEFSRIDYSMNSCWCLLLGDLDWDRMNDIGRMEAGIWFWTFSILVLQIILNMLLAVIMDVYTQVKTSVGSGAETLVSQTLEIFNRWNAQRRGEQLALDVILKVLDPTDLDDDDEEEAEKVFLKVDNFVEMLGGKLSKEQAMDILVSADAKTEKDSREETSLSGAMTQIQRIQEVQDNVHYGLEKLVHLCSMMTERLSPVDEVGKGFGSPKKQNSPKKDKVFETAGGSDGASLSNFANGLANGHDGLANGHDKHHPNGMSNGSAPKENGVLNAKQQREVLAKQQREVLEKSVMSMYPPGCESLARQIQEQLTKDLSRSVAPSLNTLQESRNSISSNTNHAQEEMEGRLRELEQIVQRLSEEITDIIKVERAAEQEETRDGSHENLGKPCNGCSAFSVARPGN